MIGVLWAYEGWQYVTFSAGETREPQRVFPRAIAVATAALVGLYLLANIAYVAALGANAAAASDRVAADAMRVAFGGWSGKAFSALVLVSIFSAANGVMLTAPRLYYSMARDGVFFERLARDSSALRHAGLRDRRCSRCGRRCSRSSGTFEQLLTYVVFTGWIVLRSRRAECFRIAEKRARALARPFRTPGYPLTPLLFVVSAALLVLNTLVDAAHASRRRPRRGSGRCTRVFPLAHARASARRRRRLEFRCKPRS